MRLFLLGLFACDLAVFAVNTADAADDATWSNIKGKVVWIGPVPVQPKIVVGVNAPPCLKGGIPPAEDYIINPANKGL